jgi:hypothetical protein
MEPIEQFRSLLRLLDPAELTHADRAALLDLIERAFDSTQGDNT